MLNLIIFKISIRKKKKNSSCYKKIINFRSVTVTLLHHTTLTLIIFLEQHDTEWVITYIQYYIELKAL